MPVVTAQAPLPTTMPAVEAPPIEAAPEVPKEEVKQEAVSPKLAELARRERQLRQLQKQIQEEKAALKSKEDEYKTSYISKAKLLENPYQTLLDNGYTYEQIAQLPMQIPNEQDRAVQGVKAELAALKAEQEAVKKSNEEQTKKNYEAAVNQVRRDATALVETNEEYSTIKESNAVEAVVELIKQTFDTDGTILSVEEAAKQVEDHLLEEAIKMASLTKVKAKLTPIAETPAIPEKKTFDQAVHQQSNQQIKQPIKTLTNAAATMPSSGLTAKQRRERAMAAFKGQLQ